MSELMDSPDRHRTIAIIGAVIALSIVGPTMCSMAKAEPYLVSKARSYIGMTARQVGVRRDLWCSAFMRLVAGSPRGVDDRAISWTRQPHVAKQIGAIAVVRSRRTHVGVVSGFDAKGNPRIISGNHNNRVAEAVYPARAVIAYVAAPYASVAGAF